MGNVVTYLHCKPLPHLILIYDALWFNFPYVVYHTWFVITFFLLNHAICSEYLEFDCLNCSFIRPSKRYFLRAWLSGCILVRCLAWLCIDVPFIHLLCPIHIRYGPQIWPGPGLLQLLSYAKAAPANAPQNACGLAACTSVHSTTHPT
jgi:hypothetical protein